MGIYDPYKTKALALITKWGQSAILRRVTPGVYNPASGSMAAGTSADYNCVALVQEYKSSVIDGTLIKQGDKALLVPAKDLAVTPKTGDIFVLSDGNWSIPDTKGNIKTLAPAGVVVMYTIQVRK